eukprot:2399176-Amphidinium_carterae.1
MARRRFEKIPELTLPCHVTQVTTKISVKTMATPGCRGPKGFRIAPPISSSGCIFLSISARNLLHASAPGCPAPRLLASKTRNESQGVHGFQVRKGHPAKPVEY